MSAVPDSSDPSEPSQQPQAPIPPRADDGPIMTAEQLAEAKRYGRYELAATLADKAVGLVYLAVMALVAARPIHDWLAAFPAMGAYRSLRLAALLVIVVGLEVCISFPLSYYSGHVLERRFGLTNQTFAAWLWRYAKRVALAGTFGAAMFFGLLWLIWTTGAYWWLVGAGAFFLVSVVLGQLLPVVILPLFYRIERLDRPELAERLSRLAQGTGLSIQGIYRIALSEETVKANAMLTGLGRTRRVLLGDTLLDRFSSDEIEVVFAHEVGHHVFGHIRKMMLGGIVFSAAAFWICDGLLRAWVVEQTGAFDYAQTPVYALPLVMLILWVITTVLEPLQNFISRRFERQSDRYALQRTGLKEAYVSAYRKLARQNKDDPDPHWLDVLLFHSHPPIAERLALAESEPP